MHFYSVTAFLLWVEEVLKRNIEKCPVTENGDR